MIPRLRELSARSAKLRAFSESEGSPEGSGTVENLVDLSALFRGLQLYAHNAHNLASGQSFFEDHEFLGELYGDYEASYDKLVELMIGEGMSVGLPEIQSSALAFMQGMSRTDIFPELLDREKEIQYRINEISQGENDQGVLQTIGAMAEESKVRSYKIGRRVASPLVGDLAFSGKSFSVRMRQVSFLARRLREFDSRPRNANGQYEPNIESGLTPDAMHAAYGSADPRKNEASIDERVGGEESQLSRKIKAWRTKGIPVPAGEEAPGGGVGSGSSTL